jgi:hypothetical protein
MFVKHPPRGERSNFLKITMTIPGELLADLRALGMKRKLAGQKDTDTSALVREALIEFLEKHTDPSEREINKQNVSEFALKIFNTGL